MESIFYRYTEERVEEKRSAQSRIVSSCLLLSLTEESLPGVKKKNSELERTEKKMKTVTFLQDINISQ